MTNSIPDSAAILSASRQTRPDSVYPLFSWLDIENHYVDEFPQLSKGPRDLLQSYVDAGKLGIKTGEGFYRY